MDSIGGAIFDEEGQEGEDTVNEEGDDQGIDENEDGNATTHGGRVCEKGGE